MNVAASDIPPHSCRHGIFLRQTLQGGLQRGAARPKTVVILIREIGACL